MNTPPVIDPREFVQKMEKHWTERLENVSSEPLRKTWLQLCEAFNDHIEVAEESSQSPKWTVVQPPTGTGKTQGTIVYCSMLARKCLKEDRKELSGVDGFPGVLIVTRLKADADKIAELINELSGMGAAVAHHSSSSTNYRDLYKYPVVVITHKAYELSLADYDGEQGRWDQVNKWGSSESDGGTRKLVIIDEAIDLVEETEVNLEGLRQTLACIPQKMRDEYPHEIMMLGGLIELFEKVDVLTKEEAVHERMALERSLIDVPLKIDESDAEKVGSSLVEFDAAVVPDFKSLREALRTISFDRRDAVNNQRQRETHDQRLKAVPTILRGWVYYAKVNGIHAFMTSRLLIPEGIPGAVILDATASASVIYEIFPHADILSPPGGSRSYRNVTLHISKDHRVGKTHMVGNKKDLAEALIADLNALLKDRRVLVVCHKGVEPVLASYETAFEMHTGHWGMIDGSNEWRDCDAAVIFGLPYLPGTWSATTFMAYQGPQPDSWLRAKENRKYKDHEDVRESLRIGQIITHVAQAINRIRCRKVEDAKGNCPPCDVYLLLPKGDSARRILEGIGKEMPGVRIVEDWDYKAQKGKAKRSGFEESLVKYLSSMESGSVLKGAIQEELGMSKRKMDDLCKLAKDPESGLCKRMEDLGARYELIREGKTCRAYFIKN